MLPEHLGFPESRAGPIRCLCATWLGRPFLNKVNGGRFSIHQQEATPFEIFHNVTAPSRSKLALVLRHQTVQAVQFFAYFPPRGALGVTTWHIVNLLIG